MVSHYVGLRSFEKLQDTPASNPVNPVNSVNHAWKNNAVVQGRSSLTGLMMAQPQVDERYEAVQECRSELVCHLSALGIESIVIGPKARAFASLSEELPIQSLLTAAESVAAAYHDQFDPHPPALEPLKAAISRLKEHL